MARVVVLCLLGLMASVSAAAQPLTLEQAGTEKAYFAYHGKPLLSFGGLSDLMFWFNDDAHDYRRWGDWAVANGMNHLRAYPPLSWKNSIRRSTENGGAVANVLFPYQIVQGSVAGGNPQFDLFKFDNDYWKMFRQRLAYLESKGVIVHLLMWNNWQLRDNDTDKGNDYDWDAHFFNPENNINGFTDHLDSANRTDLFHSVADGQTELADAQRAWFVKLIEETYDFDNVYYDLVHELGEHQGNWGKTQKWIDSMVGAIEQRWKQLGASRPLIIGMDTGGLSSTQRNWIFSRPYFDLAIFGKKHTVTNAIGWRKQYDKPYIPQEAWDDNGKKYHYGNASQDRIKMRKYFWKFMMAKAQQMDLYSRKSLGTDVYDFTYDPRGYSIFEKDAKALRDFWNSLVDYPNLWFKGKISENKNFLTNHKYVLSSDREAVVYVSTKTNEQNRTIWPRTIVVSGTELDNGQYTVDIVKPDKHTAEGRLKRLLNVPVANGSLTVTLPKFIDDIVVHVY